VMSLWGPFAVGDLDQALICFDETSTEIYRWLCRIGGSRDAPTLLSSIYTNALESQSRGAAVIDEAWLMAEGVRLVSANGPESGPAAVSIGELSPVHRALLDLSLIDDVPIDVVARIASIPSAEVGDALVDAQRLFARGFAGVPLDDFLRADEKWLDDDMRRMCRDRVANPQRPQRQAASAGKAVRPARLGDGRRNSRLTMFVSIAVVGVLLGIGALWVRPHNSASEANSAATLVAASGATSISSATTARGPTLAGLHTVLIQPPGYVLVRPPSALRHSGASEQSVGAPAAGWLDIWADPGASRTSGRWFSVLSSRCGQIAPAIEARVNRVEIDGLGGDAAQSADGVRTIRVQRGAAPSSTQSLEVMGFGFDESALVALAGSVVFGSDVKDPNELPQASCSSTDQSDRTTQPTPIQFRAGFETLRAGMSRSVSVAVSATRLFDAVFTGTARRSFYFDDQFSSSLTMATRSADPFRAEAMRFLLSPSSQIPNIGTRSYRDGQITVTRGELSDGPDLRITNVLDWQVGDDELTLASNLPFDQIRGLVASARLATADEWQAMANPEYFPVTVPSGGSPTTTVPPHSTVHNVGSSTTSNGVTWQLLVSSGPDMLRLVSRENSIGEIPFSIDASHPVLDFGDPTQTVLVIALADSEGGTAVIVHVGGVDLPAVPLVAAGNSAVFGVVAFDQLPPYTVTLVDVAGTAIKTLSTHA
jgi:hypothetical protein